MEDIGLLIAFLKTQKNISPAIIEVLTSIKNEIAKHTNIDLETTYSEENIVLWKTIIKDIDLEPIGNPAIYKNKELEEKLNNLLNLQINILKLEQSQKSEIIENLSIIGKYITIANESNQTKIAELKSKPLLNESTYNYLTNVLNEEERNKFRITWNIIKDFKLPQNKDIETSAIHNTLASKSEQSQQPSQPQQHPKPIPSQQPTHPQQTTQLQQAPQQQSKPYQKQPSQPLNPKPKTNFPAITPQQKQPNPQAGFFANAWASTKQTLTSFYNTITSALSSWWSWLRS